MEETKQSWESILKEARDGDESALGAMLDRLKPGLEALLKSNHPTSTDLQRQSILSETLNLFQNKIDQIRSSPVQYARALLYQKIMEAQLQQVKNGEKSVLNELIRNLNVRLFADPQFSKQGWGLSLIHI